MSRWVKEKYEGALAFLFILISAALPWSVSIAEAGDFGNVISFRWWVGEMVYVPAIGEFSGWRWVLESIALQEGQAVYFAHVLWGGTTGVFTLLALIGVGLLIREEWMRESLPVRPVVGILLLGTGLMYFTSSMLLSINGIPGTYVPVGALFQMLFAGILLTNQYKVTESLEDNTDEDSEPVVFESEEKPNADD